MNKSQIADVAKIIYEKEGLYGKKLIDDAWNNIHDDLMQGYYNRKYDSIRYPEAYNPEDYGFRIQPEQGFGVPLEEESPRDPNWNDPLVEDLLNNYDWEDHNKFLDKLNKEQPQLLRLINEELFSYQSVLMEDFREYQKELRKEYGIEEDE